MRISDWSSDVCSSDLMTQTTYFAQRKEPRLQPCPFCDHPLDAQWIRPNPKARCRTDGCKGSQLPVLNLDSPQDIAAWNTRAGRSEERSVGKECVSTC